MYVQQNFKVTIDEPIDDICQIIVEYEGHVETVSTTVGLQRGVDIRKGTGHEELDIEGHPFPNLMGRFTDTDNVMQKVYTGDDIPLIVQGGEICIRAWGYKQDEGIRIELHTDLVKVYVISNCTEAVYSSIEMLSGEVHTVVGGTSGDLRQTKPAGTAYAAWIDSTAGGILLGMSEDGHFCWDTDTDFIDQTTGEPTGVPSGATLVLSGGPLVNGATKYYEVNRATENTWAYYDKVGGLMSFLRSSDDVVLASLTPTDTNDIFIIEIFQDSASRTVIIVYGFGGYGTLAGALYFNENADTFDGNTGYWVYEWADNSTVGTLMHPDPPGIDGYSLIASGPAP